MLWFGWIFGTGLVAALTCACSGPHRSPPSPGDSEFWKTGWREPRLEKEPPTKPPRRDIDRTPEQLIQRAKTERTAAKLVDAAITLQQALLADSWHLTAHELYQDVQIERGRFDSMYHEYWQRFGKHAMDTEHGGSALYLYMRPILLRRKTAAIATPSSSGMPKGDAARSKAIEQATALMREACEQAKRTRQKGNDPFDAAKGSLRKLFELEPLHIAAHRLYQDLALEDADEGKPSARLSALLDEYGALLERFETSGDAVYLYERVACIVQPRSRSVLDSCARYAKAADLPGYWHYYGFAHLTAERADGTEGNERTALLKLAEMLYGVCVATDELNPEGWYGRAAARDALGRGPESIDDYRMAVTASSPPEPHLLLALGDALAKSGALNDALATYFDGENRYPDIFDFPYRRGMTLEHTGRTIDAVAAYRSALKLAPEVIAKPLIERITKLESSK